MMRSFLIFILLTISGVATADDTQRWVVGSYVNVRVQPSRTAEIVARLTANTPVTLRTQQTDFCEINWGNNQQGFVVCKLLGDKALHIEDIGRENISFAKPDPNYSPLRAFWIEPTIDRLFEAGEHFRHVMLPAEQLKEEECFFGEFDGTCNHGLMPPGYIHTTPQLKRFLVPEFEAMKKLMVDGLIAPRSQFSPLTAWRSIRSLVNSTTVTYEDKLEQFQHITPNVWLVDGVQAYNEMYELIKPPKTKPSFFKSVDEVGRASANAEMLSAQYQIPHRISVFDSPKWGGDNNSYPILMGAWDIGTVTSRLTQPVYEVAIGIKGQVSVGETYAETKLLRSESACEEGFRAGSTQSLLAGYEKIEQPWIFFRLATLPNLVKANVKIKKLNSRVEVPHSSIFGSSSWLQGSSTAAHIDLDNDGIDDLFVWDDGGNDLGDLSYQRNRLVFANVSGEWYLLGSEQEHACGC
jgi:hypothetical protein